VLDCYCLHFVHVRPQSKRQRITWEQDSEVADEARDYGLDQDAVDEMLASSDDDETQNLHAATSPRKQHRKQHAMYPAEQTKVKQGIIFSLSAILLSQ